MIASRTVAGFRVIDSYSRIVRLGEGLQGTGELNEEAMIRTLDVLRVCTTRLGRHRSVRLRAVATEACRRARNGRDFVERIRRETGLDFEIISGREEAELAVESCSTLLHRDFPALGEQNPPEWGLLLDIGGGSTEIAWVKLSSGNRKHEVVGYVSLPVGIITLAEMFPPSQPDAYESMLSFVHEHMAKFEQTYQIQQHLERGAVRVVGTSGTVTTLASLDLDLPRYMRHVVDGYCLHPENARSAMHRLHRMGPNGMRVHPCIGPERAPSVMPGCAIFEAFLSLWPSSIIVADRGLRDGLLLRMMREDKMVACEIKAASRSL
ncbi:Ppx/GppA phosphatase family protein [Acetobacter sp.]|uniref:Ppx/GppA phosphatase family protein n=1 Tax=Acetobacter sp. TaxID=440 RepID=UPI0039EC4BF5